MLLDHWGVDERAAFLARNPLFAGLPPSATRRLASRIRPKRVRRGGVVFLEREPAFALNLLAEGRIKVVRQAEGREVILRLIRPGEIFGAAGGWGETEYPASAIAREDALVLRLPAEDLKVIAAAYPEFAMSVNRELGRRLRDAEARIWDLQVERVERRIARAILRLARREARAGGADDEIALSRAELAALTGTTLTTASRTLRAWHRHGILAARRERIAILRHDQLAEIAGEGRPRRGSASGQPTTEA